MIDYFNPQRFFRRPYQQQAAERFQDVFGLVLIQPDGTTIRPHELGFSLIHFQDQGFSIDWINEELDDLDGTIDLGDSLSPRTVTFTFIFSGHDRKDYHIKKQRFRQLFTRRGVMTLQLPNYEQGRQLKGRPTGTIDFTDPTGGYLSEATVTISSASPYWESINRAFLPFTAENKPFADSMDLNEAQNYFTTENSLIVYNKGDAVIDPRSVHTPMKIRIARGSIPVEGCRITNVTNGTYVSLIPDRAATWNVVLDGILIYNAVPTASLFSYSSRSVITLERGRNEIQFTGFADGVRKEIETKYYYV